MNSQLFIPGSDTAGLFDPAYATLDDVSLPVVSLVEVRIALLILLRWNDGPYRSRL